VHSQGYKQRLGDLRVGRKDASSVAVHDRSRMQVSGCNVQFVGPGKADRPEGQGNQHYYIRQRLPVCSLPLCPDWSHRPSPDTSDPVNCVGGVSWWSSNRTLTKICTVSIFENGVRCQALWAVVTFFNTLGRGFIIQKLKVYILLKISQSIRFN
jgi:hypothetical protein